MLALISYCKICPNKLIYKSEPKSNCFLRRTIQGTIILDI